MQAHKAEDDKAIISAIMDAQRTGADKVKDVDAVAGASLGVEGIVELGRKALAAKEAQKAAERAQK